MSDFGRNNDNREQREMLIHPAALQPHELIDALLYTVDSDL